MTRISDRWQFSAQAEWLRVSFSEKFPIGSDIATARIGEEYGVYDLGARYNWEKGKYGFFIQPSIGVTTNRFFDTNQSALPVEDRILALSPVFRTEAGIQVYNKRMNYFVFGVRQQLGFSNLYSEQWEAQGLF